jgi:multidrug resistance efflux pump
MQTEEIVELSLCSEMHRTLRSRPPQFLRVTLLILVGLLGSGAVWSATSKADLIVKAPGRVRPISSPRTGFDAVSGERISLGIGGRVVEVNFREGEEVKKGDLLVRLDTERIENEIARCERTLQAGCEELDKVIELQRLVAQQFLAAREKAQSDLEQVREQLRSEMRIQQVEIGSAEEALREAQSDERRMITLESDGVVSRVDLERATARRRESESRWERAKIVTEDRTLGSAQKALILLERGHALKQEELEIRLSVKRGEIDSIARDKANLDQDRDQSVLRSPIDGVVILVEGRVGEILELGKTVMTIAQQRGFCVDVAVPTSEMGHLKLGQRARVKFDAYDYEKYGAMEGTVYSITPDSRGSDQASVYGVRIELEGSEVGRGTLTGRIKLGMMGQVEILTSQETILSLMVTKFRQTVRLN